MQSIEADMSENLRLDYQQTNEYIKLLTDIRFKLLVFTPVISGITFAFSEYILNEKGIIFIAGILGFVATLGIIIYDQRNSQLYDKAIHRATCLERMLKFPCFGTEKRDGGLFNERPKRNRELLGLILIWHDRGLALVYGASLCGWSFLIVNSLLNLDIKDVSTNGKLSVIFSGIIGLIFINDLHKLDDYKLIKYIKIKISQLKDNRFPRSERAWNNKGLARYNQEKYDKAIEAYDKAIGLDPNYAMAWNGKGATFVKKSEYDKAIEAYDKAIGLDPNYAMAWNGKGATFVKKGKYKEAIEAYDEAIKHDPELAMARNGKGATLVEQGRYDEAIKCFDEAIKLDPKYANARNNKGAALGYQGRYDEAIKCFDEAIRLDPEYANAWNNKGEALKAFGRTSNVAFAKAEELSLGHGRKPRSLPPRHPDAPDSNNNIK